MTLGSAPLAGIRVIELGGQLSAPYGAMVLADLGADVIKVESIERSDPARSVPSPSVGGMSSYYLSLNRNKRSVALNLKDERERAVFLRLVERVDVVLDNFRPGVTERLGIDHERLAEVNPRIITCSISGYGETGPMSERPGYDYLMQALAGTMSLTGEPDGPPAKYGISVVDHVGGLFAAIGILAALTRRQVEPEAAGQHVDLALLDTHLSLLSYVAAGVLNGGPEPRRQRMSAHPTIVPSQAFATSDGYIVVVPLADHFFPPLCRAVDLPGLADDPRFRGASERLDHRDELLNILEARFREEGSDEWLAKLAAAGVPAAPVQTVSDALSMEQVDVREMVVELEHSAYGAYRAIGNPVKMLMATCEMRAAPRLGEHTAEVLAEVAGLDMHELRSLGLADAS